MKVMELSSQRTAHTIVEMSDTRYEVTLTDCEDGYMVTSDIGKIRIKTTRPRNIAYKLVEMGLGAVDSENIETIVTQLLIPQLKGWGVSVQSV